MHERKTHFKKGPIIFYLSLAILFAICYFFIPQFKEEIDTAVDVLTGEDEVRIQRWVSTFGVFGPVMIVLGMMVQMFLFVVPNVLLMMIAIVSYGPVWGAVISFVGVFAASSFGYYIGGKLSKVTLARFVSIENQRKIAQFIHDYGMGTIMITRLSSFSNDGLSLVAGVLKMEYKKYITATLIGITPLIVLLAVFGKNEKIEWALIWIAAASLVMLITYIVIDKKRKKKKRTRTLENIRPETSSEAVPKA